MPPGGRGSADAITASRFSLTIDGVEIAQFSALVGITSEIEPDDLAGVLLKKLPGKRKPPTVTLRRGMSTDLQLWAWHDAARRERPTEAKKTADLTMFNAAGDPVARYHLERAWVPKIEIGVLEAGSSDVLMETVTIACENLERVNV
jgi:phage tail-like protein